MILLGDAQALVRPCASPEGSECSSCQAVGELAIVIMIPVI